MRHTNSLGDKNKKVGEGAKFKFGQLILRKIVKVIATRCHILRLECTTFDFGWGSAPNPFGELTALPPHSLAGFKMSYF